MLNYDIFEAINGSMNKIKGYKDRVSCKKIYNEFGQYLNTDYGFKIDISDLNDKIIGTSEERRVYLLRNSVRENGREKGKTLKDISNELGCSVRILEKDVKEMTERGFMLLGMNIQLKVGYLKMVLSI